MDKKFKKFTKRSDYVAENGEFLLFYKANGLFLLGMVLAVQP